MYRLLIKTAQKRLFYSFEQKEKELYFIALFYIYFAVVVEVVSEVSVTSVVLVFL